jgi:hypothetical protein
MFFSLSLMLVGPFLAEQFAGLGAPLRNVFLAWQG